MWITTLWGGRSRIFTSDSRDARQCCHQRILNSGHKRLHRRPGSASPTAEQHCPTPVKTPITNVDKPRLWRTHNHSRPPTKQLQDPARPRLHTALRPSALRQHARRQERARRRHSPAVYAVRPGVALRAVADAPRCALGADPPSVAACDSGQEMAGRKSRREDAVMMRGTTRKNRRMIDPPDARASTAVPGRTTAPVGTTARRSIALPA